MGDFLSKLFSMEGFPNRWRCGDWTPFHGYLYLGSDLAIWGAYMAIPIVLAYFAIQRKDIPYPRIIWLFAAFIFFCGTTHLIEAIIFWYPVYRFSALMKFFTAMISWFTVLALVRVTPKLLTLPGLHKMNAELQDEMETRKDAEEALRNSERRTRAILENLINGVLTVGHDLRIQSFSNGAEQGFGYTREDALNTPLRALFSGNVKDLFDDIKLMSPERPLLRREVECSRQDGTLFPAEITVRILDLGEAEQYLIIIHDLTDRKVVEEQLKLAAERAENAAAAKSQFLAKVSHEIRTPMNAVLGMSEILQETTLNEEQRQCAETINQSATWLLTIINDILDFSKIEAGRLQLDERVFSLPRAIADIEVVSTMLARRKKLQFYSSIEPRICQNYVGDMVRLKQILMNLLSNAVKFTDRGHVKLTAAMVGEKDGKQVIEIAIEDTGIGIPADKVASLFEEFSQVEDATSRRFGGTGLGLAICRSLTELMGGEVGVSTEERAGSRFWIRIPLLPSENAQPEMAESDVNSSDTVDLATTARVLVVEDYEPNIQLMRMLCKRFSLTNAAFALDGLDAVTLASQEPFDLILMDCQMPNLNGYDATRRIRGAEGPNKHTPIVALTAYASPEDRELCLECGMNDWVTKPITKKTFSTLLSQYLSKPGEATNAPPAAEPPPVPVDLRRIRDLSHGDEEFEKTYFHSVAIDLLRLLNDIEQAVADGRAEEVDRHAHTLKGGAANAGAKPLSDQAERALHAARARQLERMPEIMKDLRAEVDRVRQYLVEQVGIEL